MGPAAGAVFGAAGAGGALLDDAASGALEAFVGVACGGGAGGAFFGNAAADVA